MRLTVRGVAAFGLAAALAGCVAPPGGPAPAVSLARVDPEDAAERMLVGSAAGAAVGSGLGAIFSINAGIGSIVGAEAGATIGAAIGAATAHPIPAYKAIPVPVAAVVPEFYDTWPPGYAGGPAATAQVPPPPNR